MASEDSDHVSHISVSGERVSPKRVTVDTGDAELVVGSDASPVEYFLAAVAGCINSTGFVVARDMGFDIESLSVDVAGDVDYAAYKGVETDERAGFQEVDVDVTVEADADEETLAEWRRRIEARCPVTDNVADETPMSLSVTGA
jgi:uncharacterized OsmC-like protein